MGLRKTKLGYQAKILLLAHRQDFNLLLTNDGTSNIDKYLYSFFLINNQYLNLIIEDVEFQVYATGNEILLKIRPEYLKFHVNFTGNALILLIRLTKVNFIYVRSCRENDILSKETIRHWIKLCTGIKGNKYIEKVEFIAHKLNSVASRIFCDLLYAKIKIFYSVSNIRDYPANVYLGPKFQLDQLGLSRRTPSLNSNVFDKFSYSRLDLSSLLWTKAKHMILRSDLSYLSWFLSSERLVPNTYLERLEMDIQLTPSERILNKQSIDSFPALWKNTILRKYEKAFKVLKMISPGVKLEFSINDIIDYIEDLDPTVRVFNQVFGNVKLFIDVAKKFELTINEIRISLTSCIGNFYESFSMDMAKKLNLKHSDSKIDDILWYRGTKIKLNLRFQEYDEDYFNAHSAVLGLID